MMVDLPAPFEPTMVAIVPLFTAKLTPLTAGTIPYLTDSPLTSSTFSFFFMALPQISRNHIRIVLYFLGRTRREEHTVIQHHDAIADVHHSLHIVFNQQNRSAIFLSDPTKYIQHRNH